MKIELIEERKSEKNSYYFIEIDGQFKYGTFVKDNADVMYQKLLENPNYMDEQRIILRTEEIDVPLEENKTI